MRVVYDLLNSRHRDQEDSGHVVLVLSTAPSESVPTVSATATVATKVPSSSSSIATAEAAAAAARTNSNLSLKAIAAPTKKNQDKTLTTTSSFASSRGSRNSSNKSSQSINRRAVAIMNWLAAAGSASEVKIREAVGDSPDTSKALRLLLKRQEVSRTGAGGRIDPFLYELTEKR